MLLEQILRKQQQLIDSLKAKTMTELAKKLSTIGVQVPADLHARMSAFLAKGKGKAGHPKTLKELAVICIQVGLSHIETSGVMGPVELRKTSYNKNTALAEDPADQGALGLADAIQGHGGQNFQVLLVEGAYEVHVPRNVLLAPGAVPDEWNGRSVAVVIREKTV